MLSNNTCIHEESPDLTWCNLNILISCRITSTCSHIEQFNPLIAKTTHIPASQQIINLQMAKTQKTAMTMTYNPKLSNKDNLMPIRLFKERPLSKRYDFVIHCFVSGFRFLMDVVPVVCKQGQISFHTSLTTNLVTRKFRPPNKNRIYITNFSRKKSNRLLYTICVSSKSTRLNYANTILTNNKRNLSFYVFVPLANTRAMR